MRKAQKCLVIFILASMMAMITVPATAAALIDSVAIYTPDNSGSWGTGTAAAIGISDPGGTNNPFHNDLDTGVIIPSTGIPSGTYLAFLGYESYWTTNPSRTAVLTLYYNDSTTRSAIFQVGNIYAAGGWTQLSGGDPLISLGGGGFVVTPDRVGTSGGTNITPVDGIPDVVLEFSDNGGVPGPVPEPSTMLLLGLGLVGLVGVRRKFKQ